MTDENSELLVRYDNGIAHVTLNRPAARNALTFEMYESLAALCGRAGTTDDPDNIKAIVISGAGTRRLLLAPILANLPISPRLRMGLPMKPTSSQ